MGRISNRWTDARAVAAALLTWLGWVPAVHAAARCPIAFPGTTSEQVVRGSDRSLTVRWPAGYDPARPAPLVVLLHGSGGTGRDMLDQSRLGEAADRHGFVVAAPDGGIVAGNGFVWNIPGVPTVSGRLPDRDAPDDVAFLRQSVGWLAAIGCTQGERTYATGLSGGGRMASWLGCVAADWFAAIAPVVGLRAGRPLAGDPTRPDPASCRASRAMPVLAFAGGQDMTNPIAGGGAPYWQYPMHAAEQRWAAINGCTAPPVTRWVAPGIYEERYAACRDGAEVAARVTVAAGHVWAADNDVMWAFLSLYRRD